MAKPNRPAFNHRKAAAAPQRKPPLDRERIVAATINILDTEGPGRADVPPPRRRPRRRRRHALLARRQQGGPDGPRARPRPRRGRQGLRRPPRPAVGPTPTTRHGRAVGAARPPPVGRPPGDPLRQPRAQPPAPLGPRLRAAVQHRAGARRRVLRHVHVVHLRGRRRHGQRALARLRRRRPGDHARRRAAGRRAAVRRDPRRRVPRLPPRPAGLHARTRRRSSSCAGSTSSWPASARGSLPSRGR